MLRGLSTVNLFADDVEAAGRWYTDVLGVASYFEREVDGRAAYVEFRLGDYQHELGIIDRRFAPPGQPQAPGGAVVYWAVDDVRTSYERLLAHGAEARQDPTEYGPGFVAASVLDPFGNILGVMFNQHYLDVLGRRTAI